MESSEMSSVFIVDAYQLLDITKRTVLQKEIETHFKDIQTMGNTGQFTIVMISGSAPGLKPTNRDTVVYISPRGISISLDFKGEPADDRGSAGLTFCKREKSTIIAASEVFLTDAHGDYIMKAVAIMAVHEAMHNRLQLNDKELHTGNGVAKRICDGTERVTIQNAKLWAERCNRDVSQWTGGQALGGRRKQLMDANDPCAFHELGDILCPG